MQPPRKPPHHSGANPADNHQLARVPKSSSDRPPEDLLPDVLQRIIANLSTADKVAFLQAIQKSSIEMNDPYLEVLASHATIAQAIVELPSQVRDLFQEILARVDLHLQKVREDANQAYQQNIDQSAKAQEAAISQSVARLLGTAKNQQEFQSWKPIVWPLAATVICLMTMGMSTGWLLANAQRSPLVRDKPIQLTKAQWEGLSFLESEEGALAKNIAQWNQGQIVACQKKQLELFKTNNILVPGYGKPQSGACVVWVVPPESRTFAK